MSVNNLLSRNTAECYVRSLQILDTQNSTDMNTGSLIVNGGAIFKKNIFCDGDLDVKKIYADEEIILDIYHVTGTANSTSVSTGAAIIEGGCGIAKDIYVGGSAHVLSTLQSTNPTTGAFIVTGGIGCDSLSSNDINVGDVLTVTNNLYTTEIYQTYSQFNIKNNGITAIDSKTQILNTVNSSDSTTGSLHIVGGVGIEKDIFVGGNFNVLSTTNSLNYTNGSIVTAGGLGVTQDVNIHGNLTVDGLYNINTLNITSTVDSISTTSGALIVAGGVAIAKNLYVGGNIHTDAAFNVDSLNIISTTNATDTLTGALIVSGGASIAKNLFCDNYYLKNSNFKTIYDGTSGVAAKTIFGDGSTWKWQIGSTNGGIETINFAFDDQANFYANGSVQTDTVVATHKIEITGTNNSASTTNGSLIISGGVGIAKDTFTGGKIEILNSAGATSTSTGALIVHGGVGIKSDVYILGKCRPASETVTSTTGSSDGSSGALVVAGGVGIGRMMYVNNYLSIHNGGDSISNGLLVTGGAQVDGSIQALSTIDSSSSTTGCLQIFGGAGIGKSLYVTSEIRNGSTLESTSTSTGSLLISGGVGVAKSLYVGGNCHFIITTDATSTSNGALQVAGGMGIGKDIYCHNIYCTDTETLTANFSDFPIASTPTFAFRKVNNIVYCFTLDSVINNSNCTAATCTTTNTIPSQFRQATNLTYFTNPRIIYAIMDSTTNVLLMLQANENYTMTLTDFTNGTMSGHQYRIDPFSISWFHA